MGEDREAAAETLECLNCGTMITGSYCPACGQASRLRPLSFWAILREFVEDVWDVDSKAWRSLLPLMFRPGFLTNEYFAGRRARYVSPLRLYLTASVLFFIIAALTGTRLQVTWGDPEGERARIEATGQAEPTGIVIVQEGGCDSIMEGAESELLKAWRARAVRACKKVTADSGESLERAAIDNIPIMMVVFIPVLALVMKLIYPLSGRFYVEHLIFYLHYHAFGFFVLMLVVLIHKSGDAAGWQDSLWRLVSIVTSGYMAGYLFLAMRRVYRQGWLATSGKYFLVFLAYVVGLSLSLSGIVLYTAMTL